MTMIINGGDPIDDCPKIGNLLIIGKKWQIGIKILNQNGNLIVVLN